MANILCVDDDTIVLTALKDILSENHRCMLSKSGMDALELIEKEEPDLIILDILLDDIDGFEVVDKQANLSSSIAGQGRKPIKIG
jgi:CheY-like chemotaxis protein